MQFSQLVRIPPVLLSFFLFLHVFCFHTRASASCERILKDVTQTARANASCTCDRILIGVQALRRRTLRRATNKGRPQIMLRVTFGILCPRRDVTESATPPPRSNSDPPFDHNVTIMLHTLNTLRSPVRHVTVKRDTPSGSPFEKMRLATLFMDDTETQSEHPSFKRTTTTFTTHKTRANAIPYDDGASCELPQKKHRARWIHFESTKRQIECLDRSVV